MVVHSLLRCLLITSLYIPGMMLKAWGSRMDCKTFLSADE